jgi:hypothetical protein
VCEEQRTPHTWKCGILVLVGVMDSKVKAGYTCSIDSRDVKAIKHFGGKISEKPATCKTEMR